MGPRTLLLSFIIMGSLLLLANEKQRTGEIKIWRYLLVLGMLLPCLFFFKLDSSLGRMHIWKISFDLLTEQTAFNGVGHGNFNTAYNHKQAEYFWGQSLLNKTAMLANDGYYAFNEFLHFGIEYGWYAGVLLLFIFLLFIWQNVQMVKTNRRLFNLENVATLLLWPVAIGCWVGYPLHTTYGAVYAGSLVVLLLLLKVFLLKRQRCVAVSVALLCSSLLWGHIWQRKSRDKQWLTETRALWQTGEKRQALQKLSKFCNENPKAVPHWETLANWFWLTGKEQQALAVLERHHQHHCNQRMHETLGQWYAVTGHGMKASIHLHTSLYITPHLLRSRALLANYYFLGGNIDSTRFWVKAVVSYPPKIVSQQAKDLKQAASFWLMTSNPISSPFQLLN